MTPNPPSSEDADDDTFSKKAPIPPKPHREEDRFVYAGLVPKEEDDNANDEEEDEAPIRQAESSPYPLLNPPKRIPDPYGWMRSGSSSGDDDDDDNNEPSPQILSHLKSENAYTNQILSHTTSLKEELYQELKSKLQETDCSTPTLYQKYWYYSRTYEGQSYKVHCRSPRLVSEYEVKDDDDHHNYNRAKKEEEEKEYQEMKKSLKSWEKSTSPKTTPVLPNEQVYLDENILAKNQSYCAVEAIEDSPTSQKYLAYTVDFTGDEIYELYVKDLSNNNNIVDCIKKKNCDGSVEWGHDEDCIYYVVMDELHRPFQVYRRTLHWNKEEKNEKKREDELLFQEDDELFEVSIHKSQDANYLFITSSSAETSEVHYIDLKTSANAELQCVAKRRKKVLYDVEHKNGYWFVVSNVNGTVNKRLMTCKALPNCQEKWEDVVFLNEKEEAIKLFDGGYKRAIDTVTPFVNHVVITGREGGLPRIWILTFGGGGGGGGNGENDDEKTNQNEIQKFVQLEFEEEAHDVDLGSNHHYNTTKLIVAYSSLVTPLQSLLVDMNNPITTSSSTTTTDLENEKQEKGEKIVLKQKIVPGYDPTLYECERTTVLSRDGKTLIPVSLVYRKDVVMTNNNTKPDEKLPHPTHLYGYGSYGMSEEAAFCYTILPLLDRGIIYVIAHVRGGGEMGRQWYEEPNGGKYKCKTNTFNDFVDVAKWLIYERKVTSPEKLSCEGRSAGGLLIGASVNQAPELFRVAILGVPFVDVLCTMVDSTIPLTVGEWEEWGNPNEEYYFEYMKAYSPMNNVREGGKYPSMLLTGGLHDPRVQYWEPAKFAAELRHKQDQTTSGPVCLKMEMTAGHFSASDRYKYLKELAFDYSFLLDQLGVDAVLSKGEIPDEEGCKK